MVQAIGTDIVEIDRIKKVLKKHSQKFLDRFFTKNEQQYCMKYKEPFPYFAVRFAAKEAVSKALGTGFGEKLSPLDVEVTRNEFGKPGIEFSKKVKGSFNNPKILISLSHSQNYAIATALLL